MIRLSLLASIARQKLTPSSREERSQTRVSSLGMNERALCVVRELFFGMENNYLLVGKAVLSGSMGDLAKDEGLQSLCHSERFQGEPEK